MEKQFYTVDESAILLSLSRQSITRQIREKKIPAIKVERRVLIPAAYFERLAEQAMQEGK
jgi:excisionase family DNA binding protein